MKKINILLVDDEAQFLTTTRKVLSKKGIEVVTATSGADALQILDTTHVDVVILDVKMPGMDGNEALKKIRDRFPLVEVIMLTGHATVESAIAGMKSGAFDYLMKPADLDELLAKATEAFEKKKLAEEKIRLAQFRFSAEAPLDILLGPDDESQ